MDWIHCNKCFSQLEPGITLHLTSCGHMFCNNCLDNGVKESTCIVCRLPCSIMKLVPDMKPEIQDYFTDPEEIIKKTCEVLQFQRQHRRRLLSYLLQSTKKFYTARTELKRMTELCQKQHKQLKEYQKVVKNMQSQLANQSKVDHIPEELLLALGKEGEEKEEIGEPIIPELALRWSKIMSEGLGKEARTNIINKYPTPSNFPKDVAPIMNPEIRVTLSETSVKRDKRIVTRQNLTGKLMTCLGRSLTNILKGNINSKMLIEEINDAAKIAADIHYQDSSSRKFFALSGASKTIQDAVKTSKTDTFLFGTDCADKIKTAQTIQRTGTQITDATKQNKQSTTNKKQLNWRGPPQNQHQVHQQARGGQRPQQYPLQQHKRPTRFDRPRQTQQRQPPARSKSRHYR